MNAINRGLSAPAGAEQDEAALVESARGGDKQAFEALYRKHAGRVYGLCLRLAGCAAEAQDDTQETFVRAWQRLGEFRGDSALTTWLHRIALNEVIGRKRKESRARRHLASVAAAAERRSADAGVLGELERAIMRLPERARRVFVLHKIYGYTHQEVADMLNIAVGTCKAQVHRAHKLLADSLREAPIGADSVTGTDTGA
jgi:RNA polymerase sigma-70 factor (ECF subfamily)